MPTPTTDELWQRLDETRHREADEAKAAELERLLDEADATGDPLLVNTALCELVRAYEFSLDPTRALTPFARLLRNHDTAPEHFTADLLYLLHWMFKWIVENMIDHPDVPRDAVEHWLTEMRRRYAEAGHSDQPVHHYELQWAAQLGDHPRARAAREALRDAKPDTMSECVACGHTIAAATIADGPAAVLDELQPVLDGEHSCPYEPHYALGLSLLPLAELGHHDHARANHLRGYTLVRGQRDQVKAIVLHIEFCALSGNEARALEILAEHAHYLDLDFGVRDRRHLLDAAALTARRLLDLGRGDTRVPGPAGHDWTAAELHHWADTERRALAAAFDHRNGNGHQTARSDAHAARRPLAEPVALGFRTLPPAAPAPAPAAPADGTDLDDAIDAAYAAYDTCDEHTDRAWLRVDAIARALGVELIAEHRAEIALARSTALRDDPDPAATFARAADLFRSAGQPARALVAEAAAAIVRSRTEPETARTAAVAVGEAAAGHHDDRSDDRNLHTARALALRAETAAVQSEGQRFSLRARIDALDAELAGLSARYALLRRADLAELRADLADDPDDHLAHLDSARTHARAAEARWVMARVDALAAQSLLHTGRTQDALARARDGIDALGSEPDERTAVGLYLTAAEAALQLRDDTIHEYALRAAVHADRAGLAFPGGIARHLMGLGLIDDGRDAEAMTLLEAALPDLADADSGRVPGLRVTLAECYARADEPRRGVEHALAALTTIDEDPDRYPPGFRLHAMWLAADHLARLGDHHHAADVLDRIAELADHLGDLPSWARAAGSRATAALRVDGDAAHADSTAALDRVVERLRTALDEPAPDGADLDPYRLALAETHRTRSLVAAARIDRPDLGESERRTAFATALDHQRRAVAVLLGEPPLTGPAVNELHGLMWLLHHHGDAAAAIAEGEAALDWIGDHESRQSVEAHLAELRNADLHEHDRDGREVG